MNAVLILVSGLPGAGKSFFSKKLSEKIHALRMNTDLLRKELFPETRTYSELEKQVVYDTLLSRTKTALIHKQIVIVDATFYKNSLRMPFYELARALDCACVVFYLEADEALTKERTSVSRIDSEADFNVYLKLKDLFEPIEEPYLKLISEHSNIDALLSSALTYLTDGKETA